MDKKKSMRRMAGAMAVVVAAGAAGTCGYQRSAITAKAAETDTEKLEEVAENALSSKSDDTEETGTSKEESVYVKADPSGKVKKTTVTEWLKNTGKGTLSDTTDLDDIKNIKGDEKFKESGDELSWEAVGDDIYYQGTTEKELPVGVKISYKLDGKDISAKDLQGKDGKVEIHIKYTNTSKSTQDVNGTEEEVFTPFTMITAMMLPADQYENVQIDNGKVISDAERQIVVGLGFPGLNDNLKLEDSDLELPEEVTITADVKDATIEPSITVATTDFLQDLDTDKIDDFSDLSDSIDELKDATNQLVDGSKELADGTNTLNSKSGDLISGVDTLANGVTAYTDGVASVADGANTINSNMALVQNGVSAAVEGTGKLAAGVAGVQAGLNTVASGIDTAVAGLNTSSENIKNLANQTALTDEEKQQIVDTVSASLDQAGLSDDQKTAVDAAIASAVNAASNRTSKKVTYAADQYSTGMSGAATQLGTASTALTYVNPDNPTSTVAGGVAAVGSGINELQTKLGEGTAKEPGLTTGVAALASGVNQLADGANKLNQQSSTLNAGMSTLKNGGAQLASGVGLLASGANTLAEGMAEYKTEAIDKLTSLFDGDIANVTNRLKAITDAGKDYKSFAGIKSDMSGRTKFIIETEGIDD